VRIDHNASLGVSDAERRYVASIPEGSFILGSGPESSNAAEKPRRRVNISAFQIDQFPVSNADFKEFVDRTGHSAPPYIDHEVLGRDNHPVVGVNWDDAMAYANWKGGRLPTEAEWEYVAKGGEKRIYPWGDDQPTPTHANIDRVYEHTTPVGQFAAGQSGFGVSDLCGNTWEWCQDSWNEHQYDLVRKGDKDPVCALQSDEKSVRGGAFNTFAEMGRNAARYHFKSDTRSPAIGFRLVYPAEG
ncbi:MAG: formylglycine-generating enzyme family protein, partial [Gammaproteobacteria bacterium]